MRRQSPPRRHPIRAARSKPVCESGSFATLSGVRLNQVGITGGAIYLILGLLWVWFAHPPAATWALVGWFAVVAVVECFIPGEANQVSLARAHLAAPALVYALASTFGPLAVVLAVAGLTHPLERTGARPLDKAPTPGGGTGPIVARRPLPPRPPWAAIWGA